MNCFSTEYGRPGRSGSPSHPSNVSRLGAPTLSQNRSPRRCDPTDPEVDRSKGSSPQALTWAQVAEASRFAASKTWQTETVRLHRSAFVSLCKLKLAPMGADLSAVPCESG